jgi:hypothetical protein
MEQAMSHQEGKSFIPTQQHVQCRDIYSISFPSIVEYICMISELWKERSKSVSPCNALLFIVLHAQHLAKDTL